MKLDKIYYHNWMELFGDAGSKRRRSQYVIYFILLGLMIAGINALYYLGRNSWFWSYFIFEYRYHIIGLSFYLPFLYSAIVLPLYILLSTLIISVLGLLPLLIYYYPFRPGAVLMNIAFLSIPFSITATIVIWQNWLRQQKKIAKEREKERQNYISQIFKAQEDERKRITQELHDDTTQKLMAIAACAKDTISYRASDSVKSIINNVKWIRDTVLLVAEDIRRLSLDLRPSILDNIGLIPAIRWLVDDLNRDGHINTQLYIKGEPKKLNEEKELTIFRIVQEALNNARKHSDGTEVRVSLEYDNNSIRINVEDNGKGFPVDGMMPYLTSEGKMGILGMQQRAKSIGGVFIITSSPGMGTIISVKVDCIIESIA